MNIEYTGRNTNITPKLKRQADTELARIAPMARRVVSAHIILTEDKYRQIAEITMNTGKEILVATCEHTEMSVALHDALRRIEQQAIRHRQRKTTMTRHPRMAVPVNEFALPAIA